MVEYYRYSFFNEGIQPISQKLTHSKKPNNLVMLNEFLGLANFSKQFIDDYLNNSLIANSNCDI